MQFFIMTCYSLLHSQVKGAKIKEICCYAKNSCLVMTEGTSDKWPVDIAGKVGWGKVG